MVEIIAIIKFCMINKRNAKANGRKGWVYVLLTIFLWIGMEMLGAIIGYFIWGHHWLTYAIALIFAITGGVLSRILASRKNRQNSNEVTNKENYMQ